MVSFRTALQVCAAAVSLTLLAQGGPAHASSAFITNYQTVYDITYPGDSSTPDITNVMLYQVTAGGSSLTWGGGIGPLSATDPDQDGVDTIVNPFQSPQPTTFALILGLTTDADSSQHVVLGMSEGTAAVVNDEGWDTIFPNTPEQTLINALLLSTSGEPFCATGQTTGCIDPSTPGVGLNEVFDFSGNDATDIVNPNTDLVTEGLEPAIVSAQFGVLPSDFVLESFSNGVQVGAGSAVNNAILTPAPVPEPATWATMLLGFGGLGAMMRRARGKRVPASLTA